MSGNPYAMTGDPTPAEEQQIADEVWLAEQERNGDLADALRDRRKDARIEREDAA